MDLSQLNSETLIICKAGDLQQFASMLVKQIPIIKSDPVQEIEKPIPQPEALEFLGKSRQTFSTWRRKGIIKAHVLGGRIYYLKSELLEAMKHSSTTATK